MPNYNTWTAVPRRIVAVQEELCANIQKAKHAIRTVFPNQEALNKETDDTTVEAQLPITYWRRLAGELLIAIQMGEPESDCGLEQKVINKDGFKKYDEDNANVEEDYKSYMTAKVKLKQTMLSHIPGEGKDAVEEPDEVLRLRVQLQRFKKERPTRWESVQMKVENNLILAAKDTKVAEKIASWEKEWEPYMKRKQTGK